MIVKASSLRARKAMHTTPAHTSESRPDTTGPFKHTPDGSARSPCLEDIMSFVAPTSIGTRRGVGQPGCRDPVARPIYLGRPMQPRSTRPDVKDEPSTNAATEQGDTQRRGSF